jgi:hypothetical protein
MYSPLQRNVAIVFRILDVPVESTQKTDSNEAKRVDSVPEGVLALDYGNTMEFLYLLYMPQVQSSN